MIIIKLKGGLGNQMFQYALGKNLSLKNKTDLKLNIIWFEKCKKREMGLSFFNTDYKLATEKEIRQISNRLINNLISFLKPSRTIKKIAEKNYEFDKNILLSDDNSYLNGFWQSEKYFANIRNIIKHDLSLKKEYYDKIDKKLLQKINQTESVSIHIRRGDYIKDKKTNEKHGTCSIEYYVKGINLIEQKIKQPHIFIFSDDIKWCKKNIKTDHPITFIEGNKNYEDLHIMSKCKHNIIANSSFSWWGAWLNDNPDKMVIAPKKWFNDKTKNTKDLIPESWIKI